MVGTATGEVDLVAAQLRAAKSPEEIFGELDGDADTQLREAKRTYRRLARVVHPDHGGSDHAFERLNKIYEAATRAINDGRYGRSKGIEPFRVRSRRHMYEVTGHWRTDEIATWYRADINLTREPTWAGENEYLRVVRKPRDGDLISNEGTILRRLNADLDQDYVTYLPKLIETFGFRKDSIVRKATAVTLPEDLWSLQAVIRAYPAGVHPKDAAWIFRRLLVALGAVHQAGIVHGAVLPSNVLVQPEQHGLVLANWSYATTGDPIKAIDSRQRGMYPQEVLGKEAALPETDIYMAAATMAAVVRTPDGQVAEPFGSFLSACMLPKASRRPDNAWALKESFDERLERTWGRRRFHPFAMPSNAKEE